ncbi:MAG: hypothetical protein ACI8SK_001237 [Shewanella sp.]|jgi:hypothetical protein
MIRHPRNILLLGLFITLLSACDSDSSNENTNTPDTPIALPGDEYAGDAFEIQMANIKYQPALDSYLFTLETLADAASVAPTPVGQVDGAPVLGYVFVTNLAPTDIGYNHVEGTVALAVTSHPDFDDTPLWDDDNNGLYDDDGIVYHSHWVVLEENSQASAGLAVVQAQSSDILTPTSPMPMYLDSPGFTILEKGNKLHVIVPANAVKRRSDFTADALTAYLEVDASGAGPLLKVERIYSQHPTITVEQGDLVPESNWPVATIEGHDNSLNLTSASVDYVEEIESLIFTMQTMGDAATKTVTALGQVDGAPVLGYVFPTTISPEKVGFKNISGATLALAVTTHPDFDDTPLWDENGNSNYQDDGIVYHTHWVALVADDNSGAGLSVPSSFDVSNLPPTAPMSMYLDSPNFHAFAQDDTLRIIVPVQRVDGVTEFNFDGVTASMNVDLSGDGPVLRVNTVHDILSGDLSLPYSVTPKQLTDY